MTVVRTALVTDGLFGFLTCLFMLFRSFLLVLFFRFVIFVLKGDHARSSNEGFLQPTVKVFKPRLNFS
jgi:hypothetical protein